MGISESTLSNRSSSLRSNSEHRPVYSRAFDESTTDLKENLPTDLKIYSNAIIVVHRFWYNEIETMTEQEFTETAVLFCMNALNQIPELKVFLKKNIELQSKQFFGMFRWLITNLKYSESKRLTKTIRSLGALHQNMNIKEEWYYLFLDAFHQTMIEMTQTKYTPRTRFGMEQLYTLAVYIMLNKDFHSLSSIKIAQLFKWTGNLEDCLEDKEGREYLELYMRKKCCVELILFYEEYCKFRSCTNEMERKQIGSSIVCNYIDTTAQSEINISWFVKENIFETLKNSGNIFSQDIFDVCVEEVIELIETNTWSGFKKCVLRMSMDFGSIPMQSVKSTSTFSDVSSQTLEIDMSSQSIL